MSCPSRSDDLDPNCFRREHREREEKARKEQQREAREAAARTDAHREQQHQQQQQQHQQQQQQQQQHQQNQQRELRERELQARETQEQDTEKKQELERCASEERDRIQAQLAAERAVHKHFEESLQRLAQQKVRPPTGRPGPRPIPSYSLA